MQLNAEIGLFTKPSILKRLPRDKQHELLDFAEFLLSKNDRNPSEKDAKVLSGPSWEADEINYDNYDDTIR